MKNHNFLLTVRTKDGLLSLPAFEVVFDTMSGAIKERIHALMLQFSSQPIPEAVAKKATHVALNKDLNNFRQRYLGFDDDDEVRDTFRAIAMIRSSTIAELKEARTFSEISIIQEKLNDAFEEDRTARADLRRITAELYQKVCMFETLEQYFARLCLDGELDTREPHFNQHLKYVLSTEQGMMALNKLQNGVVVDPL